MQHYPHHYVVQTLGKSLPNSKASKFSNKLTLERSRFRAVAVLSLQKTGIPHAFFAIRAPPPWSE